jgi:hypothetical protein
MSTGEERLYTYPGITFVAPRWFSDESAVIIHASPSGGGVYDGAFYRVDLATGVFTEITTVQKAGYEVSSATKLSHDDSTLYGIARDDSEGPWTTLVGIDVATGEVREIAAFPDGILGRVRPGIALSPDGTTLALHVWDDDAEIGRILTVRVDGSGLREVYSAPEIVVGTPEYLRWTPDGQSLIFPARADGSWRTMIIPATGGTPTFDGLDSKALLSDVPLPLIEIANIANIDLSHDGSRIAFSMRTIPTYDLWVLDNVPAFLGR